MTMANKVAEASAAETSKEGTMALVVEEAVEVVVKVDVVEEAEEATATTTTMEEEVLAASMETEEAAESIMDTTTTSIRVINNTLNFITSNKCLLQLLYLIPRPATYSSRITTWTAMPIRWVAVFTVANGAINTNNDRD